MTLGHKNPQTTAKPRKKPLVGMSFECGSRPTVQLSALEECYFPELGWGGGWALECISILIIAHEVFSFEDIPEYYRNKETSPRSTVRPPWPQTSRDDDRFCTFSQPWVACCRFGPYPRLRSQKETSRFQSPSNTSPILPLSVSLFIHSFK